MNLPYGGPALQPGHRYHWQVRAWDDRGTASEWSVPAFWETGLMRASQWKAKWISPDIAVPDPAAVAGGVVFVLGTGENTQQVNAGDISQILNSRETHNNGHAILHALDAYTGKELWSSGSTIESWTHFSGIAIGDGKVFAT